MRIFDETKTYELSPETIDYTKGYLKTDKKFVMHHEAVAPKEAIYSDREEKLPNGSTQIWKDLVCPAVKAQDAYDEYEDIQVYVLYTEKQLAEHKIEKLKQELANTDYQAIKYAEGLINEYDYLQIKNQRQSWRDEINRLELIVKSYV